MLKLTKDKQARKTGRPKKTYDRGAMSTAASCLVAESHANYLATLSRAPREPLPAPWDKAVRLWLPGDPLAEMSPNINPCPTRGRASMMKKARIKKKWQLLMEACWEEEGSPTFTVPIEIEFQVARGRKLDPDNALAGLKDVIDALTGRSLTRRHGEPTPGMVPDDSDAWVSYRPLVQMTGGINTLNPYVLVSAWPVQRALPSLESTDAATETPTPANPSLPGKSTAKAKKQGGDG